MATSKPAKIFPSGNNIGLSVRTAYGSVASPKYQVYGPRQGGSGGFEVCAPVDSTVIWAGKNAEKNANCVLIQFDKTVGLFKKGDQMMVSGNKLLLQTVRGLGTVTTHVKAGKGIAAADFREGVSIAFGSGNRFAIALRSNTGPSLNDGNVDPTNLVDYSNGRNPSTSTSTTTPASQTGTGDSTSSSGDSGGTDVGTIAKAAAFTTFFTMPGIFDRLQATHLEGQKSLLNDQPLLPFVEQLTGACLRHFMSTPSGDFFAFYPDYFGGLGKTAYWLIDDVEIISGSIELSDDNLATHVYVVGDTFGAPSGAESGSATVDWLDNIHTSGVVTIFNAFMADFLNGHDSPKDVVPDKLKVNRAEKPTLANYQDAIAFLQKYGARPHYEQQATVRAPIYEAFLAYQKFCLKWSEQFKTQFEFTFMPELFPGGLVAFPDHGLQCYVASVTHNCSYENGFTTSAELMAPSAYRGTDGSTLDPDRSWVHAGMIRSWPTTDAVGKFEGATDTDPAKKTTPAGASNASSSSSSGG
jgi:hypothetical protein